MNAMCRRWWEVDSRGRPHWRRGAMIMDTDLVPSAFLSAFVFSYRPSHVLYRTSRPYFRRLPLKKHAAYVS